MNLIARYTLDTQSRFDIHLLELETAEVINVIPYSAGAQEDHPLMELAREWAAKHNHTITDIDSTQLHA